VTDDSDDHDRGFRPWPKSVTFNRNRRSRSVGTTGHVQAESAVNLVRNTQPKCARGYIRIIPAGWSGSIPSVNDIAKYEGNGNQVWPQAEGSSSGDYGTCKEGFVRYWLTGETQDDRNETRNVAMYFDETGEFWILHGMAIGEGAKGQTLYVASLMKGWAKATRTALTVHKHFNALPVIRIEAGLVGVEGVRWPGQFNYQSPSARKDRCLIQRQQRDWSYEAQLSFLTDAYNKIRDLYGLDRASVDAVRELIGQ
jgi:hypothetical protein